MKLKPALASCVLWLMAIACQSQIGFVSSSAPAEDYIAATKSQLALQLKQWRAQQIHRYIITYEFVEDTASPATVTRRMVVIRSNAVLDTRCPAGACPASFLRDVRLIPELFELIDALPERCVDQVQFNRDFYYPEFVSANCAADYSKPFTIRVTAFAPEQ